MIADQLNRTMTKQAKRIVPQSVKVAYQTLSLLHDNNHLFNFPIKPKQPDQEQNQQAVNQSAVNQTINQSAVNQSAINQSAINQSTIQPTLKSPEPAPAQPKLQRQAQRYILLVTNKFSGTQHVVEKIHFKQLTSKFSSLYHRQRTNTYEEYVYDLHSEHALLEMYRHFKQDQEPRPVSILIKEKPQVPEKLIILRMNA